MKVIVNVPFKPTRRYMDDFIEETIPNIGDKFDDMYIVKEKTIDGDTCILDLKRSDYIKE